MIFVIFISYKSYSFMSFFFLELIIEIRMIYRIIAFRESWVGKLETLWGGRGEG